MSINPFGANTAGDIYSLECSVTVTDSLANQSAIDITWLNPMNNPVQSEMVTTISTLTFNPLSTDSAGTYTCSARTGSTIQNETISVVVESKSRKCFFICKNYLIVSHSHV